MLLIIDIIWSYHLCVKKNNKHYMMSFSCRKKKRKDERQIDLSDCNGAWNAANLNKIEIGGKKLLVMV